MKGPVSHPHNGDKAFPVQRCKWPSLPCPGDRRVASRGVKRGLRRCSRSKGWSRADAACHCARWPTAARKEGSRVDSLANTLSSLAFSQLLLTTSGWRWAPSVGLGWGGSPLLCNGESKAEAFHQRFCSSEAGLVLGRDGIWFSESFPEHLTSIHLGLPPRGRSVGSKDTLTYLPSISSTRRLAEKVVA